VDKSTDNSAVKHSRKQSYRESYH